ncbi:hypothetical protein EON63_08555 [archaeon]|nr:MAG: hypothetical protein EON63_08555 [archaeon]
MCACGNMHFNSMLISPSHPFQTASTSNDVQVVNCYKSLKTLRSLFTSMLTALSEGGLAEKQVGWAFKNTYTLLFHTTCYNLELTNPYPAALHNKQQSTYTQHTIYTYAYAYTPHTSTYAYTFTYTYTYTYYTLSILGARAGGGCGDIERAGCRYAHSQGGRGLGGHQDGKQQNRAGDQDAHRQEITRKCIFAVLITR